MCVIIVAKTTKPNIEVLEQARRQNDDGIGIAWIENDYVCWKKGIDLTVQDIYQISQSKPLPQIIHFRKTSSGSTCNELCHPFPVSNNVSTQKTGKAKQLLFHNGTIRDWKEIVLNAVLSNGIKPLHGEVSDSRYLALLVHKYGEGIIELIAHSDRVALFSPTDIKLFGSWTERNSLLFSNYTTTTSTTVGTSQPCPFIGKETECSYKAYSRCPHRHNSCPYNTINNSNSNRMWF